MQGDQRELDDRIFWTDPPWPVARAGNLGLAVQRVHAMGGPPTPQGMVVVLVQCFPIPSQWQVVRRRTRPPSPIAQAFADHLLTQAPALQVAG